MKPLLIFAALAVILVLVFYALTDEPSTERVDPDVSSSMTGLGNF